MSEKKDAANFIAQARQLPPAQSIMQLSIMLAETMNTQQTILAKLDALGAGVNLVHMQHLDIAKACGVDTGGDVKDEDEAVCRNCANYDEETGMCDEWTLSGPDGDTLRCSSVMGGSPFFTPDFFSCHVFERRGSDNGDA